MLTHKGTRTIQTERLLLRRFARSDAPAMYENWASDSRVTHYLTWTPHESVEATKRILKDFCAPYANPAYYHWAIEFAGQPIGAIRVVRQSDRDMRAEIGYCIGASWWNRGIATEAVQAVIDYLFSEVGVHRVELLHATDNPASGRVAEKCGFSLEGVLRGHTRTGADTADTIGKVGKTDAFRDIRVWGILREEWEAGRHKRHKRYEN